MAQLAVPFEANEGQFAPEVAYVARTFAGTLFVTRDGKIVHALAGKPQQEKSERHNAATSSVPTRDDHARDIRTSRGPGWTLVESLQGASALAPVGSQPSATRVSRFSDGPVANQTSDIATFNRVRIGEAWPGVAVELAARGSNVEKLFTVAPGADPKVIRLRVDGAESLRLGADGSLVAATGNGDVAFTPPVAFQEIGEERTEIPVRYVLLAGNNYRFEITGAYDSRQPLVIDPLLQSTYAGGSDSEFGNAMALDASGNVFVVGSTRSTNFPGTSGGAQPMVGGTFGLPDAFIQRLSNDLQTLTRATYLGGSLTDIGYALVIDANGEVLVAGSTNSTDFPGTAGGAQPVHGPNAMGSGGNDDGFVARLSNDLQTLVQATYAGGVSGDAFFAIALDASGNVFAAGVSNGDGFPGTAGGAQATRNGLSEAIVERLSNDLTTLSQATYLGGSQSESIQTLKLDASGNVYVAGFTFSPNFPGTTGGAQPAISDLNDAFIALLSNDLATLTQATYLGGNSGASRDTIEALALDAGGNVIVAGSTAATVFPGTTGGAQPTKSGMSDAFVARLSSDLTTLMQATYLGGSAAVLQFESDEIAYAIVVAPGGDLFVAGQTTSTDFPATTGGAQATSGGNRDAFVARLSGDLTTLRQATYLGGSGGSVVIEHARDLALDASGNLFVAGTTDSINFPGTSGGPQPVYGGGGFDAFVAKLTADLLGPGGTMFTVTATAGPNGSVSPITQMVASGNTAVVTVTPNAGFMIASVTGCGGSLSGNTYTTAAVIANCTVSATFAAVPPGNFTVTATAGANGSVSPITQMVASGNTAVVTVTPNAGFMIASVTGCGGSLSGNTYTTAAVTANCTVVATFAAVPPGSFTVTATAGSNGSVSPASQMVPGGNTATVTVTPNAGFSIDSVSGCGAGTLSGNTYTTAAVTANCTVVATFAAAPAAVFGVPTLSEWSLILLALLLAGAAFTMHRHRPSHRGSGAAR